MTDQPESAPSAPQPAAKAQAGERVLRVVPPEPHPLNVGDRRELPGPRNLIDRCIPPEPHPLHAMHPGETDYEGEDAERLQVYLSGPTAFCA